MTGWTVAKRFAVAWIVCCTGVSAEEVIWIGDGERDRVEAAFYDEDPAPVFTASFTMPAGETSADITIACAGYYALTLNGRAAGVSRTSLMPLWSPFDRTVYSDTFTADARDGSLKPYPATNVVTVTLGNGFYNLPPLRFWGSKCFRNVLAHGRPCFTLMIPGVPEPLDWTCRKSNITRNCVYLGTEIDATRPATGGAAHPAARVLGPKGKIVPRRAPVVDFIGRAEGRVTARADGSYIVDFGANLSGVPRFVFAGEARGRKIEIVYGERLNADGTVNVLTQTAGQIKKPGRGGPGAPDIAAQRDAYICGGAAEETFEPPFTWHICRYAEIRGAANRPASAVLKTVSSVLRPIADETRVSAAFRPLREICVRTFRDNLIGVQSDCPGRERLGYGGDIVATAEAMCREFDMLEFYLKTLQDFADEAAGDGWITETAPYVGIADGAAKGTSNRRGPISWTLAVPVLMDTLLRHHPAAADRILAFYPICARYIRLMDAVHPSGLISSCIGDHEAIERAPNPVTATAHWHEFTRLTAGFAKRLGREADAAAFEAIAAKTKAAFVKAYVKDGIVANGTQSAQALGLYLGLVPEGQIAAAEARLLQAVAEKGYAPTTGIFTTRYMLMYLSEHGHDDTARKIVLHAGFPGWMHMIERGATTLWETWKESADAYSNCHPMFGSVDEWILRFSDRTGIDVRTDGVCLPGQGVELLVDGKMNPACAIRVEPDAKDKRAIKPVTVTFDFGAPREVGGIRLMSGRTGANRGVSKASFHGETVEGAWKPLAEHVAFRPSNTYKENFATWAPVVCRRVRMTIEGTYDQAAHYYCFYTWEAEKHLERLFETPPYRVRAPGPRTVQIAEARFFGKDLPADLPLPNADGSIAFPETRLVRDWQYQDAATSNVSHCANVETDTTKPDPMGRDIESGGLSADRFAERMRLRRDFLKRFRAKCDAFIYVKHLVMANSIMHATDDLTDASFQEWKSVPDYKGGSQLIRATIAEDGSVSQEVLLDEPKGVIRDPALSADAKTLLFSKRASLEADDYHLWKMDLATKAVTQITFNGLVRRADVGGEQEKDFDLICSDIEPCWLPDGSILFQSTRCCHSVDCWPLPVSNLYRCEADGSRVRRIGFDQVQTFYPQVMDDGRVSFTKWEYNDRSASGLQQLYAMNPDGTKMTGLFANNSEFPFSLMHTRGIPGTRDIMMLSCGHHVAQKGRLARSRLADGDDYTSFTYDPAKSVWGMNTNAVKMVFPGNRVMTIPWSEWDNPSGPATTNIPGMYYVAGAAMNGAPGVQPARQPHDYQYNAFDMHTQFGPQWAYPYPLGDGLLLVSFMPEGCSFYRGPYSSRFGVYAMDESGRRELLAFDWGNHCLQPIAYKARRAPERPMKRLDYREGFGTYYVQNVYEGAAAKGIAPGSVKRLRVIGLEYRPVHIGWNWQYGWHSTQGKIGTPISVGNGAYDVKHVLGEAEVEADGSCSVLVPARTPVYFQLVDKDGCMIQTMRSWSTLMPGEVNGCIGCHEHPHQAGLDNSAAIALRKPPQRLKPWLADGARHPFVEALEKEGPLANLDNWMGLNRPKRVDASDRGDGFGFGKDVQPILDRKCVSCHDAKHRIDLRAVPGSIPPSDDQSHRAYTASYLAFSEKGKCTENVNFAHGLGFAPFKPPRSFGAARSKWYRMLAAGHKGVKLTDAERRTIALWIDLCVPFCSSYVEANKWDAWHAQRYLYTNNKRSAFHWLELNDVRAEYGLGPVPLTGFEPNVAEPRKQKYWSE